MVHWGKEKRTRFFSEGHYILVPSKTVGLKIYLVFTMLKQIVEELGKKAHEQ